MIALYNFWPPDGIRYFYWPRDGIRQLRREELYHFFVSKYVDLSTSSTRDEPVQLPIILQEKKSEKTEDNA